MIAIDGPAASGKSTLARRLAGELGLVYLDTGAFYRAAALAALRAGVDLDEEPAVMEVVGGAAIEQEEGRTRLDGEDVEAEIRTPAVTRAASRVAALGGVRWVLVDRQRRWVEERGGSAVVEGRDIGSVVFPDAPVKVYLVASSNERTRRRAAESGVFGTAEVGEDLARRDRRDTIRAVSPLRRMPDASVIDTTSLSPEEAAAAVLERVVANPSGKPGT